MIFPRSITSTCLRLALCLGLCQLGFGPPSASADIPPGSALLLKGRMEALETHFHGGQLARWSVPDDKAVMERVWDVPGILGKGPYATKDVGAIIQIVKAQAKLLDAYTGAGGAQAGTPKAARVRTKYQDEIVRASAFLTDATAAMLQAMSDFASKLKPDELKPQRRQGIEEGRKGMRDIIESFDAELKLPDVSEPNKMILLDALASNAATIAANSSPNERKRYVEVAEATLPSLSDAGKAKLQTYITAMATTECKGLCAFK